MYAYKNEDELCTKFVEQFAELVRYSQVYNPDKLIWYHIPNGQRAGGWGLVDLLCKKIPVLQPFRKKVFDIVNGYGKIAGARDKRLGALKGVPDYFFSFWDKNGDLCFGWLEAKTKTGRLTPEQVLFRDNARKQGAYVGEFRSIEQAFELLKSWGLIKDGCIF